MCYWNTYVVADVILQVRNRAHNVAIFFQKPTTYNSKILTTILIISQGFLSWSIIAAAPIHVPHPTPQCFMQHWRFTFSELKPLLVNPVIKFYFKNNTFYWSSILFNVQQKITMWIVCKDKLPIIFVTDLILFHIFISNIKYMSALFLYRPRSSFTYYHEISNLIRSPIPMVTREGELKEK